MAHLRLGHLNSSILKAATDITRIKLDTHTPFDCQACNIGLLLPPAHVAHLHLVATHPLAEPSFFCMMRTVCRRAERSSVQLVADELIDAEVQRYLNRLSDFLFVAGRMAASREGRQEIVWRKSQPKA